MDLYTALRRIIEGQGSKFMLVEFVKKDGSYRRMRIQAAATKFRVKGEAACESAQRAAATRAANHPNLFNVYDVDQDAIRSVNFDTLLTIQGGGRTLYARPESEVEAMFAEVS